MAETTEQTRNKVAMVVVAHEDDAEFDGAGTVALWTRDGWDVYYVICADGGSGGLDSATDVGPAARKQVIETRMQEQRAAAAVLGVKDVFFLGYPDGQLEPSLELRRDIVRLLRHYQPSRVVCQSPDRSWTPSLIIQRYHRDHLTAGRATLEAIYPASQNPWDFPELMQEGLKPHKVSEILITGAPVVNFGVDITTTMDTKLEALHAHTSQIQNSERDLDNFILSIDAEIGKKYGYTYAEEFHRVELG
jgi:LmbE family N-acetylglucosaminyl deacetylase